MSNSASLPLNWRAQLSASLHRHRSDPSSRYLQLATVDVSGHPRNRTIVFRGFLEGTECLQFATDSRSEKVLQLHHQPRSELCWSFAKTREQFRIAGSVQVIMAAHHMPEGQHHTYQWERAQLWEQLSDNSRLLWYWPDPKAKRAAALDFIQSLPAAGMDHPPENFVMLLLSPTYIDHLQLKGDDHYPQTRHIYRKQEQGWIGQAVNP
ncbi:MAG: pyridoxamine 5'-phosphate oxidase [Synechococcaceae cyanobacterium SM2_3_1]|nr:pyridoxamine 5'-phosphate oxidase [Synechococcaceae cyanobacterium SM2_3_1]